MICGSESTDAISYFIRKNCHIIFKFDVKHTEVKLLNDWIVTGGKPQLLFLELM